MSIRDLTNWTPGKYTVNNPGRRKAIDQLHCRMDRIWDDFLSSWDTNPQNHDFQSMQFAGPCVDVFENEKEYRFEIELPALTRQEVKMFVGNNILTVKGQKKSDVQSSNDRALHLERSYGAFERTFELPIDVSEDKIDATFDNGVLVVRLRKNPVIRLAVNQVKINSGQNRFNRLLMAQDNEHRTRGPGTLSRQRPGKNLETGRSRTGTDAETDC